ncbi:MAG: septation protein IspZ [Kordiimonadaceae bacterium]|jgi:intracellular septation protein|nr:septation protein IspZ [Kordiimonadaceae bacterium]MDB4218780.1 septation protein IspZ [Emcibacteraceae bacterium]MBT6135416.1 septation protein IspZ [Kordiimonadaceae bacterium]MBT6467476.1 septation protein IspZ [Kordiimonadaceae bacterium]MBT7543925.1 septation protein IspZ [Kordiimonadaceae bacterium]|tara:strand:+ start:422 stop:1000 length:579 start_codon:yes stop_codon:yes gene_type:complete
MNQIIKLLIELGPLIIFFYANNHFSDETGVGGLIPATKIFMIAMPISMICSKIFLKKIAPMLWISAGFISVLGGLTIYFDSEIFIKIKPTIVYLLFSSILLGGYAYGKPFIKTLFEAGLPPIKEIAWLKISRNWGIYFIFAAMLNEYIWRNYSNADWLWAKIWVFMPLSLIFAMSQMPLIMKHVIEEEVEDI